MCGSGSSNPVAQPRKATLLGLPNISKAKSLALYSLAPHNKITSKPNSLITQQPSQATLSGLLNIKHKRSLKWIICTALNNAIPNGIAENIINDCLHVFVIS